MLVIELVRLRRARGWVKSPPIDSFLLFKKIGRQGKPLWQEMASSWRLERNGRCASIVNTTAGQGWQRPFLGSLRRGHTRILLRAANRRGMSSKDGWQEIAQGCGERTLSTRHLRDERGSLYSLGRVNGVAENPYVQIAEAVARLWRGNR
jgi:hypothetical protein